MAPPAAGSDGTNRPPAFGRPQAPVIFATGRRGTGKSSVLRSLTKKQKRVLVVDPFREHAVVWVDDAADLPEYLDGKKEFRVGIDTPEDADAVLAYARELRDCSVIIEEMAFVAPPGQESPIMKKAIAQGRHWNVALYASSQRPYQVSRLYTGNCSDIYLFASHEPRDVTYLRSVCGEVAVRLATLPDCHGYHWTPDGRVEEITVDPKKAVIEIGPIVQSSFAESAEEPPSE